MGFTKKVMVEGRVTVVMPCFNDEPAHLRVSVDSVLAQTYPDVELVIVDDGSTNETTLDALSELEAKGIRVIHTANNGPAAARNLGIAAGTGRYVLPVDADDCIDKESVEHLVAVLQDPRVRISFPRYARMGEVHSQSRLYPDLTLTDLLPHNVIPVSGLFRKSDWSETGGYDEDLRIGLEDWEWWVRLLLRGGIARQAPNATLEIRVRPGSRTEFNRQRDAGEVTRRRIVENARDDCKSLALDFALWELNDSLATELQFWKRKFGPIERTFRRLPALGRLYAWILGTYGGVRAGGRQSKAACHE